MDFMILKLPEYKVSPTVHKLIKNIFLLANSLKGHPVL